MRKQIKRIWTAILVAAMLVATGCAAQFSEPVSPSDTEPVHEPTKLINMMSEAERASVSVGELTLLDEPWNNVEPDEFESGVFLEEWSRDDFISNYREQLEYAENSGDDEYAAWLREYLDELKSDDDYCSIVTASVCGSLVDNVFLPNWNQFIHAADVAERFRTGNIGTIYGTFSYGNGENDYSTYCEEIGDYEQYKSWLAGFLSDEVEKKHITKIVADRKYEITTAFYDALIAGEYKIVPCDDIAKRKVIYDNFGKKGSAWEFDREEVEAIKDSITEIHLKDDAIIPGFVCHVVTPPDYDENKTYPIMLLSDAVWRFGDIPAMRREMEEGRAQKQILASIGFDYRWANTDDNMRGQYLIIEAQQMDDFITNDLMPLLTEMYSIDCEASTFFGHSNGGYFSHYMLFHSDMYENQPFGRYIIGSPSLWSRDDIYDTVIGDYGYWERNETLGKEAFITVGALEDPDYQAYFGNCDSTIVGAERLTERIREHGGSVVYKPYEDSHHYQYIPDMLIEYIDGRM